MEIVFGLALAYGTSVIIAFLAKVAKGELETNEPIVRAIIRMFVDSFFWPFPAKKRSEEE